MPHFLSGGRLFCMQRIPGNLCNSAHCTAP